MIYINFIIDYLFMISTPFSSYFILYNLNKSKIIDIFIIGLVYYIFYKNIYFLFILVFLFLVCKYLKFSNLVNNMIIFLLFNIILLLFNDFNFYYLLNLVISLSFYIIYNVFNIKFIG